jgi:hypothetical protein
MYKLCYYVPEDFLDATKQAVFDAGAGKIGDYDQCCWQVKGTGQFRPLPGSDPFLGVQQQLEKVDEYRVELVCPEQSILAVIAALKAAHPYEEPAYDVVKIVEF